MTAQIKMDSRFRGNDVKRKTATYPTVVIPAKAGIHLDFQGALVRLGSTRDVE
jgi:hypothetical protein